MKISTNGLTAELTVKNNDGVWGPYWILPKGWPVTRQKMDEWTEMGSLRSGVMCPLNGMGEFVTEAMGFEGLKAEVTEWDTLSLESSKLIV